jgi:beta-mannosidase
LGEKLPHGGTLTGRRFLSDPAEKKKPNPRPFPPAPRPGINAIDLRGAVAVIRLSRRPLLGFSLPTGDKIMHIPLLPVSLVLAGLTAPAVAGAAARQTIPLDDGWEFRQQVPADGSAAAEWRPAQVPGDVHLDLLRHQIIPDPFFRDNESKLQWIEGADWEYRKTLPISADLLRHNHVELVFDGLDAYCEVSLNGQPALTADNMFRIWRVDVKPFLHPGDNLLRIVFPSPIKAAEKAAAGDRWRTPIGIAEKTYVRKAAYEYGWDWGPRFVTSGIWRPARLEIWDDARIADLHLRQRDVSAAVAHLNAEVEVLASTEVAAEVTVQYERAGRRDQVARRVALHAGLNHVDLPIEIGRPDLWWPVDMGAQPLYAFSAQLKVGAELVDERKVRTGLRSVALRREPDAWGRSFEFVINGVPVFAKGADVIPFDSLPNRVTGREYRRVLESARDAHMNMIRHWGGGYYETDEFYDLCDELGIMVWQDFMFGNDWQPGVYRFKLNVAQEIEDQMKRLRDHACIVLWCGNNETEGAFDWITHARQIEHTAQVQMWKDYLTLFYGVIGQKARELAPETPFWSASPTADFEEQSDAYRTGDFHDWSVWHGRVPFADYEKHVYRFVSEYGFQSFPEMRTIEVFTAPEDRTGILTPVMLAHQKNQQGNAIIHDYTLKDYPEPKDFASFLYVSQVLQAEGIKVGAEHLRRNRPRTMGSLFWQLNDCWPVASWSSIDYFGRWKALQYYARRFYAPVLVSPHVEDGTLAVYVVSDRLEPVAASLRARVISLDGRTLDDTTLAVNIPAQSSQVHLRTALSRLQAKGIDFSQVVVATDLTADGRTLSSNLVYLVPTHEIHLPAAAIESVVVSGADGCRLRLSAKVLARSVHVTFGKLDARPSDDYFDLIPGQPVEIRVEGAASAEELRRELKVQSLVDAF